MGIFVGDNEAGPGIIRMNFRIIKPKFGKKWSFCAYSHVIYRWKGNLKQISVMGIFADNIEVESHIFKMNFRIIKPKFGQKWTYSAYSHVIYRWKGILKLISVVEIFVGDTEAGPCIIRTNFCIMNP